MAFTVISKNFSFLNAVFLMLKYVDEENSEYPATAECAVLAMPKTPIYLFFKNSRGTVSTHRTNNLDVQVMFGNFLLLIRRCLLLWQFYLFISKHSRGTVSTHRTNNLDVQVMFGNFLLLIRRCLLLWYFFLIPSQNKKSIIMVPSCT